ncbi:MAG: hypothetical protein AB4911_18635 [Oscillochloridaceae bacterium umkhey_bin13]
MTTVSPPPVPDHAAIRAASDRRLQTIFPRPAPVWVVNEEYGHDGPVWRVTLICQGERGRWMWRRYRYDIPSDTIHFAGEQPASDSELLAARRDGRRL